MYKNATVFHRYDTCTKPVAYVKQHEFAQSVEYTCIHFYILRCIMEKQYYVVQGYPMPLALGFSRVLEIATTQTYYFTLCKVTKSVFLNLYKSVLVHEKVT